MKTYEFEIHYKNQPNKTIFIESDNYTTAYQQVENQYKNDDIFGIITIHYN